MNPVTLDAGPDQGLAWHYGDPLGEQRRFGQGAGAVDLGNRAVVTIAGADGLKYLDVMSTQRLVTLASGDAATAYFLDPRGHVTFDLHLAATDGLVWAWTAPGRGAALAEWLEQMKFRYDVTVAARPDIALVWLAPGVTPPADCPLRAGDQPDLLGGTEAFVPRDRLDAVLATTAPAGVWAYEARRIAAGIPRTGVDTDDRTIPNELGVPSCAVALDKGCYPGQETVAKIYNLGQPPRRLVRLHLDGSAETFVPPGTPLAADDGSTVGRLGAMAYHWELGPIGLGLVRRDLQATAVTAGGVAAALENLVDPDAGRHVRPDLPSRRGRPSLL
ncbi:MAG: folate-binding protein [Propionibacteriaceae bacterium]|nr:folate-binding protein [Propionibacteriaceae bacterium]